MGLSRDCELMGFSLSRCGLSKERGSDAMMKFGAA